MIDRRAFLRRLGFGTVAAAAAATGAIDLERLLWSPSEKTIFIPPAPTIATLQETLEIGDIFTIGGRYAINPQTRRATKFLQQFVVTETVQSGSTLATVNIRPIPYASGPYQNVSRSVGLSVDGRDVKPLLTGRAISLTCTTS